MSAEFHYIISGLPDLHFEDRQPPMTLGEFDALVMEQSAPRLIAGLRLLQLHSDGKNLINHWYHPDKPIAEGGQWQTKDEMQEWIRNRDTGPQYFIDFVEEILQKEVLPPQQEAERKMAIAFGNYATQMGSGFLHSWFQFEQNLHNFLAAQDCRNFGYDMTQQLADDEDFTPMLFGRREEDFGLGREYHYILELSGNLEKENVRSKERQIDRIRWREAGNLSLNRFFSEEVLYAYRIRLEIISRWQHLTEKAGHERLNEFLDQTIESFSA